MTPFEKWKRLANPQSVQDWGLSMSQDEIDALTEEELKLFPEGHALVSSLREYKADRAKWGPICLAAGANMARVRQEITKKALQGG